MSAAALTRPSFDVTSGWRLHPSVSVRPEPFGALLYHFGTRQLSFLKDRRLLAVVDSLDGHLSALAACEAAGVRAVEQGAFTAALARLATSSMIVPAEETA